MSRKGCHHGGSPEPEDNHIFLKSSEPVAVRHTDETLLLLYLPVRCSCWADILQGTVFHVKKYVTVLYDSSCESAEWVSR